MEREFDASAITIIVVFGALTIGGLMAATIAFGERDGFLLALGASTSAWATGYAMIYQRPKAFRWLLLLTVAFAALATVTVAL